MPCVENNLSRFADVVPPELRFLVLPGYIFSQAAPAR